MLGGKHTKMARAQWKTRTGFLLAAIGSAIGLGNIWRFPYMAYENGGGAFLIPYLVALLTAGIPLMILEYGIGHKNRGSAPLAYARVSRKFEWVGWWAVMSVMFGIVLYYNVIISWCLNYFVFSFDLSWGNDTEAFFNNSFLKIGDGPWPPGNIQGSILSGLIVIWFVDWIIVFRGVQKGIELANKIFMPALFILVLTLFFWSLSLEGAGEGIKAYLKPDLSKLSNPKVWLDAYSQIFFTLSIGFGIMVAYASYLPERPNISGDALITCLANCSFSIFAGFVVFAILGYMSVQTQKPIDEVVSQGIGLSFVAFPKAIGLLPAFREIFGMIFFLSLTVAGISSSVSIIEAFNAAIVDKFDINRKWSVTGLCILGFMGSLIFATRGGLFWVDIVDHFIAHYGLVSVGVLESILVGWILGSPKLREHINKTARFALRGWWDVLIKYFIPFILGLIILIDLYGEFKNPYGGYPLVAVILIGLEWLIICMIAATFITLLPWRKAIHSRAEQSSQPKSGE